MAPSRAHRLLRAAFASASAFALAWLMAGASVHGAWLLCRAEQAVHRTCCCQPALAPGAWTADDTAALQRAPCCDALAAVTTSIPPSAASAPLALPPPVLLARALPPRLVVVSTQPRPPVRAIAVRDATGPPIPIKHRALLL